MSQHSFDEKVLALAAIFQAAAQVRELARKGQIDNAANSASLDALFVFDAPDTPSIFGGVEQLSLGLRTLVNQLERPAQREIEITQYTLAVIHLADRVRRQPALLDKLSDALQNLQTRQQDFALGESTQIAQLEGIYQDHISKIQPPIMVKGEPVYLQNPENAARVRALLLAGIRAAILWRQVGGSKWQLMFNRKRIAERARELLD